MVDKKLIIKTLCTDPDTGEEAVKTTINLENGTPKEVQNEIKKMLMRASPDGQIKQLRKIAEELPDHFPEKKEALWWLVGAVGANDDLTRMRAIAEAKALLEHAKLRTKGVGKRKLAKTAGAASGVLRKVDSDENASWVLSEANKLLSKGIGSREVVGRIFKKIMNEVENRLPDDGWDYPGNTIPTKGTIRRWTQEIREKHNKKN